MVWYVLDSIISPDSDTAFSLISSPYNLKLVIWYDSQYYLSPGDKLETAEQGLMVNDHLQPICILDISLFRTTYWEKLQRYNNKCPGNGIQPNAMCIYKRQCRVKQCPFVTH